MSASMLFCKDLSGHLLGDGFVPNHYDVCVDESKISHVDSSGCEKVVDLLNKRCGNETPVTVTRGDLHENLDMTLDSMTDGKVAILMEAYVENMLADMPNSFDGTGTTAEAEHLFKVNDKAESLGQGSADRFHSTSAKILFVGKRARLDVQTPVAFLCTRVKAPDVDNTKKLRRLIRYLRETKKLCLTLEANNLEIAKWWVDVSFASHRWGNVTREGCNISHVHQAETEHEEFD